MKLSQSCVQCHYINTQRKIFVASAKKKRRKKNRKKKNEKSKKNEQVINWSFSSFLFYCLFLLSLFVSSTFSFSLYGSKFIGMKQIELKHRTKWYVILLLMKKRKSLIRTSCERFISIILLPHWNMPYSFFLLSTIFRNAFFYFSFVRFHSLFGGSHSSNSNWYWMVGNESPKSWIKLKWKSSHSQVSWMEKEM